MTTTTNPSGRTTPTPTPHATPSTNPNPNRSDNVSANEGSPENPPLPGTSGHQSQQVQQGHSYNINNAVTPPTCIRLPPPRPFPSPTGLSSPSPQTPLPPPQPLSLPQALSYSQPTSHPHSHQHQFGPTPISSTLPLLPYAYYETPGAADARARWRFVGAAVIALGVYLVIGEGWAS
ncbi:hypothetical protein NLJ89_g5457 [Agrocybe chaxingu]|uniref:Uncharacterized protein n=1 Tax=Agrocybe chaxingu TaxID=84603 RepID=A0A9W8K897_9AGAR|nr:hypothetical protein NLJ89_g5457 [Agrocybe chaxingu]